MSNIVEVKDMGDNNFRVTVRSAGERDLSAIISRSDLTEALGTGTATLNDPAED